MKLPALLLGLCLVLAGCLGTPADRIARHPAEFGAWPADVQERVRRGEIAPGFTAEQVQMALGEPDRVFTRQSREHGEEEVWIYRSRQPRLSIGLGLGGRVGSGYLAGGTVVNPGAFGPDEVLRVTFAAGRVAVVERSR